MAVEERNGYTFDGTDSGSMSAALDRALALFRDQPQKWNQVICRSMQVCIAEQFAGSCTLCS
eukprot:1151501-Pelagomonas_calceolata.AAC.2